MEKGAMAQCIFLILFLCIYREAFEPTVEQGEFVVRYRVKKSYSRRTTEATCKLAIYLSTLGYCHITPEYAMKSFIQGHVFFSGR